MEVQNKFICYSRKEKQNKTIVKLHVFDHTRTPYQGEVKLEMEPNDKTFKVGNHYNITIKEVRKRF